MNANTPAEKNCSCGLCAYVVAILGSFLIVAGLVWIMMHFTRPPALGEERADFRRKALAEIRQANAEALNNYGWQDAAKGIVRLPIAEAMKIVETQWGANPAAARSNLIARVEKATYVPPPPPPKPSSFE